MRKKHSERIAAVVSIAGNLDLVYWKKEKLKNELRKLADDEETGETLENLIFEIGLDAFCDSVKKWKKSGFGTNTGVRKKAIQKELSHMTDDLIPIAKKVDETDRITAHKICEIVSKLIRLTNA